MPKKKKLVGDAMKLLVAHKPQVFQTPKTAKGGAVKSQATSLFADEEELEATKYWLATSMAARQFGNGVTLDPLKDITGNTSGTGAAHVAGEANTVLFGACKLYGLVWDWVTPQEVSKCKTVLTYIDLLAANIVEAA